MENRKENVDYIDKIMDVVDFTTLQKMDDASFTALIIALVDVRVRVLDVCVHDKTFINEMHKDYVNDFIIAVQEYGQCRKNFVTKYLFERIGMLDNGRSKDNSRRDT